MKKIKHRIGVVSVQGGQQTTKNKYSFKMRFGKIIIVLLSLLFGQLIRAQEKRELDWQTFASSVKTTQIAVPVKSGTFTIFQINNINKFLYKVEIEGRVFELQTPVPTELQNLFRLTSEQLEKRTSGNKVKEAAEETGASLKSMDEAKKKSDGRINLSSSSPALNAALNELVKTCTKYLELSNKLADAVFELKHARNKLISTAKTDRSYDEITNLLGMIELPDFENIRFSYQGLRNLYAKVELQYKAAEKVAEEAAKATNAEEEKKILADIKEAEKGVEKADDLINEEALLSLIDDVEFLSNELKNKKNFTVVAPPVQMDGDLVSYVVNITPSSTRELGANKNPMQFKFDIPAKSGLKVDFSVGPTISFGKNGKNDKYYLEDAGTSPDSAILKKLDNNNSISPGIAALMHFYSRSGKWISFGGLFGIGAGFQNAKEIDANIYAGLSIIMGKREKVMVSLGNSWMRVDRLKTKQYEENKKYATPKINLPDVTEKVFKPAFFISVSYNLTNKIQVN